MLKEDFYTAETISVQANLFLDKIKHLPDRSIKINPGKCALLVIDMQKYFVDPASHSFIPSMPAIVPNIKLLQNACLKNNLKAIQTKHSNNKENAGAMLRWWKDILDESNSLNEILPELHHAKIKIITKTQYDAFWKTDLEQELKMNGIEQLIISGVMTHLCCETTARSAFIRGFDVFFAIDATATYNRDFQQATVLNLAHGFAVPMLTDEIIDALYLK